MMKQTKRSTKIGRNIAGVDWEAETKDPAAHMPKLNNNQYAALVGNEDDEENDTKRTGVENNSEITGGRHVGKITGVDSDNESTGIKSESGSMGATNKLDEMAFIEEAIAESERDIAEGNDILSGTETETEDTRNENVIHPYLQLPTVEHTYNLWRRRNMRPKSNGRKSNRRTPHL